MPVVTITPDELTARRARGEAIELIDVRTPVEFREVHADLARNVPLDALDPASLPARRTLYLICRTGARGRSACERLAAAGHAHAVNVEGGTLA